jgi:hypothetical protein
VYWTVTVAVKLWPAARAPGVKVTTLPES